ncbi:hypothetical protein [Vitiosangium sp. GDMCC 1.1324]|uniref:hypothetical protein n=1 Tax=Vitiosangium sp. (strain GDMCC 1.1324) TaxID=2138576 RepID=UPI000D35018E|nr:hypothetical protein [Vitiosangium sp. GDMCC 1.1324]PTL79066.1 hypothetical protein DAT35_36255 [Vitiosangium sp. GDMCC 1.1324]
MFRSLLMIACLTFPACRAVAAVIPPPESPARAEVWVDGARNEAGDGTRARPFTSLAEALARAVKGGAPLRVHLAPGRYAGPIVLPAGLELVGAGEGSVLRGEGAGPVVRAPEGAFLRGLDIQGGGWGLEGSGPVLLEAVRFRGQGTGAVRVEAGHLTVVGGVFEAGGAGSVGVMLGAGSRAEVREGAFVGAFRRGVEARDSEVELESARFQGPLTALYQVRGRVLLRHAKVEGGNEVGLFVQRGTLRLEDVTVTGHEYGLQGLEATLEGRDFTSVRAVRAGVALIGSRGELEDTVVLGSGSFGALSLVGSDIVLRGVRVDGADAYGITATRGRLLLQRAVITRLTSREKDSGDGLHLRDAEVEAEGLVVRDVVGAGVLAAQGSRVVLRDTSLELCREAGVWAETLARVTAEGLQVLGSGGPALVALEDGELRVDALVARDNAAGLVMADCQGATGVKLGRVTGQGLEQGAAPAAACVGRLSP